MHASNGILFNHEGPTRGETFVTRKISRAVSAIQNGFQKTLYMGNIDSLRDWGDARDYVKGMYLILQQDKPDGLRAGHRRDAHSARVHRTSPSRKSAARSPGAARGVDEEGADAKTGEVLVKIDPRYFRPTEVELLLGDPSPRRARCWAGNTRLPSPQLVKEMVASDLKKVAEEGKRNS